MKFLSVVIGAMYVTGCSGAGGEVGDPSGSSSDPASGAAGALVGAASAVGGSGTGAADPANPADPVGPDRSSFQRLCARGAGARAAPTVLQSIKIGAARLSSLQADTIGDNARNGLDDADPDDGGWDFTVAPSATGHTAAASPTNLFGETGLGVWAALTGQLAAGRALITVVDAGVAMQNDPDIDSPPDFLFGVQLARLTENPGFAQVARAHYDAKRTASGGAPGLAALIRDGRHARNEDGLIAYDLGWLTLSAAALDDAFPGAGYAADADLYAKTVVDDLTAAAPDFNLENPGEAFYVIGAAWSQVATAWVGDGATFQQARTRLLDQQHANGAWGTSAAQPADDLQSTALALQTLALTDRATGRSLAAELRAARFLLQGQVASGGWPDASNTELPLIDAEILLGLALAGSIAGDDGLVPQSPFVVAAAAHHADVASPLP